MRVANQVRTDRPPAGERTSSSGIPSKAWGSSRRTVEEGAAAQAGTCSMTATA
nr:MAG TPA: hypothetical protein [Caudoviricetes sp.]